MASANLGGARTAALLRRATPPEGLWLDVHGRSMEPTIHGGSRVLVKPGRAPARGEVWAFCDDAAQVLVHRCLHRRGDLVLFRGDARCRPDRPVPASHVIGAVTAVEWQGERSAFPSSADRRLVRGSRRAGLMARRAVSTLRRTLPMRR